MPLDIYANFAKATVSTGYTSADVTIILAAGQGALFPAVAFNATWWNSSAYADASDDPNKEIVRVTNIVSDTLTISRAQEGTAATNKNTVGAIYKLAQTVTAKLINEDLKNPYGFTGVLLVNGANQNVNLSAVPVGNAGLRKIVITGPNLVFNIGGFSSGIDGERLTVLNNTANLMTLNNKDAGSSATNQIFIPAGSNFTCFHAPSVVELMYSTTLGNYWYLLGLT